MVFRPVGAFSCISQLIHLVRGWSSLLPVPSRHSWTSSLIQFDCWSSVCCLEVGYCWLMLRREDKIGFFVLHIPCFRSFSAKLDLFLLFQPDFHHQSCSSLISLAFPTRCCMSIPLLSLWYLQFHVCSLIFLVFCNVCPGQCWRHHLWKCSKKVKMGHLGIQFSGELVMLD